MHIQLWHKNICKKTRQRSIRRLLMRVKVRMHALMMGKVHRLVRCITVMVKARRQFSRLPGSYFARTKFSHVIASASLIRIKKLISTSVWKNPLKYISIDQFHFFFFFFTMHMTSICEKKSSQTSIEFHHFWKKNRHSWRVKNSSKTTLNQWESIGFCNLMMKSGLWWKIKRKFIQI